MSGRRRTVDVGDSLLVTRVVGAVAAAEVVEVDEEGGAGEGEEPFEVEGEVEIDEAAAGPPAAGAPFDHHRGIDKVGHLQIDPRRLPPVASAAPLAGGVPTSPPRAHRRRGDLRVEVAGENPPGGQGEPRTGRTAVCPGEARGSDEKEGDDNGEMGGHERHGAYPHGRGDPESKRE